MDVVQSATVDTITPKGKIPNDMVDPEQELDQVDVGAMAGDQAMSAVKDDLPQ